MFRPPFRPPTPICHERGWRELEYDCGFNGFGRRDGRDMEDDITRKV